MHTFHGLPVSPGYGRGSVFVYRGTEGLFAAAQASRAEIPEIELRRFEEGLRSTRRELKALQQRLEEEYGGAEARILGAHLLMLDDPLLVDAVRSRLRQEATSAEAALTAVVRQIEEQFAATAGPYLLERAADVHDVGARILRHLADRAHHPLAQIPAGVVIVADRLVPSDTIFLDRANVGAMVTERGSENSHAAILARAAGIPAVTQVRGIVAACRDGDPIAVDGVTGLVIVHPEGEPIVEYARRERRYRASVDRLRGNETRSVTLDGVAIRCMANVSRAEEMEAVKRLGAEGIGLLRTEFLFLSERGMVSEAEQAEVYARIAAHCAGEPVTIRTLDLAPDKLVPLADDLPLAHASIGERGVHYSLSHPEIFRPQLRAILRAATCGNVRILLPMVTGVGEIEAVRALLEEVRAELATEGVTTAPVPLGAMIETPPAVMLAPDIVEVADFISIGSNDLLHYLFAADRQFRTSTETSEFEPSLLRAIDVVVRAGQQAGKEVAICGEMAGTPAMTLLLVGLGLRALSMSPQRLAEVRYNVREIDSARARQLAEEVLRLPTAEKIRRAVLGDADPWHRMLEREESREE
jgi:phosphoenolpyruvate-protein phosphotransferase